jgi:plasmid stabilization system protein ParE
MKFRVVWKPAAERQLAEIWLSSPDRDAVTAASEAIESALSNRADELGESRPLDCRIAFVAPLAVTFRVTVADRLVEVASVRHV